jgi:hypothetical protein
VKRSGLWSSRTYSDPGWFSRVFDSGRENRGWVMKERAHSDGQLVRSVWTVHQGDRWIDPSVTAPEYKWVDGVHVLAADDCAGGAALMMLATVRRRCRRLGTGQAPAGTWFT